MLEHHLGPTSAVCIHFVFSCRRCLANFSPGIDFNDQREPRRRGERRRRDPSPFIPAAPRGRTREGRIAPLRRRIKDLISRARIMPTSPSLRGGKGGGAAGGGLERRRTCTPAGSDDRVISSTGTLGSAYYANDQMLPRRNGRIRRLQRSHAALFSLYLVVFEGRGGSLFHTSTRLPYPRRPGRFGIRSTSRVIDGSLSLRQRDIITRRGGGEGKGDCYGAFRSSGFERGHRRAAND